MFPPSGCGLIAKAAVFLGHCPAGADQIPVHESPNGADATIGERSILRRGLMTAR